MDSARQIIRWSIPGAALLMTAAVCYMSLRWGQGDPLTNTSASLRKNLSPTMGIALSIPLGFAVYQLYYLTYTPRRWWGIVAADRGKATLDRLSGSQREKLEDVLRSVLGRPVEVLSPAQTQTLRSLVWTDDGSAVTGDELLADVWALPPAARRATIVTKVLGGSTLLLPDGVRRRRGRPWQAWSDKYAHEATALLYHERCVAHHAVASILLDSSAMATCPGDVKNDSTAISDIFHSQGATRTGILVGALGAMVLVMVDGYHGLRPQLAIVIPVLVALLVATQWILNRVRSRVFRVSAVRQGYALRALYSREPELLSYLGESPVAHAGRHLAGR